MLDRDGLVDYIDAHYREPGDRLFRLEQLPFYADNAATLARWRAGETEPDWDSGWSKILADEHDRGLIQQRVRLLSPELTDDERASCLLAYPTNGRYEEVRILREGEHAIPTVRRLDYWLIEPVKSPPVVLVMHYAATGIFVGAEEGDEYEAQLRRSDRDRLLAAAEPFSSWYPRHAPELLHRKAA